jgi:phosphoribosylaminoimidazole carboxylase (NCAIR synthetase)
MLMNIFFFSSEGRLALEAARRERSEAATALAEVTRRERAVTAEEERRKRDALESSELLAAREEKCDQRERALKGAQDKLRLDQEKVRSLLFKQGFERRTLATF